MIPTLPLQLSVVTPLTTDTHPLDPTNAMLYPNAKAYTSTTTTQAFSMSNNPKELWMHQDQAKYGQMQ